MWRRSRGCFARSTAVRWVKDRFYHRAARRINGRSPQFRSCPVLSQRDRRGHHESFRVRRSRRTLADDRHIVRRLADVTVSGAGSHLVVIGLARNGRTVDEGKSALCLESPFIIDLEVANLLDRLTLLGARDCKAAQVAHLLAAGVAFGSIPAQPNSIFRIGGLKAEDFLGTRRLRRYWRWLHAASEENGACKRGNHERKRQPLRTVGFPIHRRPSSLRRRLTVDGAGPPSIVRRAIEFSARRIAIASAPNALECRLNSAMLKSSSVLPASAVSRTIAPTISCARRNAVPRTTRYSARSVASAIPPAAARMRLGSNRSIGQNFASRS